MAADCFSTISQPSEGIYREKMSKFMAFAHPVASVDEAKEIIKQYQKKYFDARHVCWAYMLGADRLTFQSNDNGEPSGTAGKPILGQINSFGLTNIIIIVVRYFGGIKLGTSGLIVAYREAAREAIEAAEIIHCHETANIAFSYAYEAMNDVMKLAKQPGIYILEQSFDNICTMTLSTRRDNIELLRGQLSKIPTLTFV
ncbi:MAG: YigZ family protein [Muribaculaceae bacterium]|nr:YigZ family protein [Muribaculaceae bacterium]